MGLKREECHNLVHEVFIWLRSCILVLYFVRGLAILLAIVVRYAAISLLIWIDTYNLSFCLVLFSVAANVYYSC